MNYKETIAYLFGQLPMYQRIGDSAMKKDLTNIRALMDYFGNVQDSFPSIHIAGTNGKGSTAHLVSSALQAKGLRVGLYTSPHYKDFRERIKINGHFISEERVTNFVERHRSFFEQVKPSFFEITVAMAFVYFAQQQVDIAVIETGLGGRLDSTNILKPIQCIITNISFDHQQFLGNTLPLIAGEKAGIIKPSTPVIIGEVHPETINVFQSKASEVGASLFVTSPPLHATQLHTDGQSSYYNIDLDGLSYLQYLEVDLLGKYQHLNLQTALRALTLLPAPWKPSESNIRDGFANLRRLTSFMGRWQILGQRPLVICDSAHNESGIQWAMEQLQQQPSDNLHIVLGMLKDKDLHKLLSFFPTQAIYYFAKPTIPRGLNAQKLKEIAHELGLNGWVYDSVPHALREAKQAANETDVIFVGGSTFVVAEVI